MRPWLLRSSSVAAVSLALAAPALARPIVAAGGAAVAHAATAVDADAVVDEVQRFYAGVPHVTAKFRQTVTLATFGKRQRKDGRVWIETPGKMRWDYYARAKKKAGKKRKVTTTKSFISDGSHLYVVDHQNKEVFEKDLSKDVLPVAVTFLYGKGDLRTDFTAAIDTSGAYGEDGDVVLALTPKAASAQYATLYLVVARTDAGAIVRSSVIVDSAGNVNQFEFFDADVDSAVAASLFGFDPSSVPSYRVHAP